MSLHTSLVLAGILLGLALAAGELFVPATVFLWSGISLVLTSLLWWLVPALSLTEVIATFVLLSIVTVFIARWAVKRTGSGGDRVLSPDVPNEYAAQFVGRRATLTADSAHGMVRISINGAEWGVKLPDGDLKAGTEIKITGSDGIYLVAGPASQKAS